MQTLLFWFVLALLRLLFWIENGWHWVKAIWKVAVHKAWISTVGLFALYLVLGLEQMKDVIEGIDQFIQLGPQGMQPGFRWTGVIAYASLWLSGLLLAVVLALIVEVTGHLDFRANQPARSSGVDRERVVFYYASAVLAATLLIVHFEYVSEVIFPATWAVLRFTGISFAIIAPWIVLRRLGARCRFYVLTYTMIGLLLSYLNLTAVFLTGNEGFAAIFISTLTPACALLVIFGRGPISSKGNAIAALIVVSVLLSAAVWWPWSPWILLRIGAIAVAFVWMAWVASALACVLLLLCVRWEWVRRMDWVAAAIIFVIVLSYRREKVGQEWLENAKPKPAIANLVADPPIAGTGQKASTFNGVIGKKIAVHADGGGLRAALFTAEVLAFADDLTCGDFGAHVFAASGVSGGSLGIATWATMRQELVLLEKDHFWTPWSECNEKRKAAGLKDGSLFEERPLSPLWSLVLDVLLQDHLSMPLASTLSTDLLRPWGAAQRGQALLDSWQDAVLTTLASIKDQNGANLNPATREGFAADLKEMNAGLVDPPLLIFSATEVNTGERFAITNTSSSIQIGVAALDSARFPLISPVGAIRSGGKWRLLADGGYFDNSGAASLRDMLFQASGKNFLKSKVTVIRINGNALEDKEDNRCKDFNQALVDKGWLAGPSNENARTPEASSPLSYTGWSGIDTYIATRTAHAAEATSTLSHDQMPDIVEKVGPELRLDFYGGFDPVCATTIERNPFSLKTLSDITNSLKSQPDCMKRNMQICSSGPVTRRPPLGWYLSRIAGLSIEQAAYNAAKTLVAEANKQ